MMSHRYTKEDAINRLRAEMCGKKWRYYAEETATWYRFDVFALDALVDLMNDDDPSISRDAYSHWCASGYGEEL